MARLMEIVLEKRNVSCVARLLDDEAPLTCDIVWNALPLSGDVWHAKYASNEIYCLVPPIQGDAPGIENSTTVPTAGDIAYFYFPRGYISYAFRKERGLDHLPGIVDLAVFYGRNNFLFDPAVGFVPGNIYARITENFEAFAKASHDVWRSGSVGERLIYRRLAARS